MAAWWRTSRPWSADLLSFDQEMVRRSWNLGLDYWWHDWSDFEMVLKYHFYISNHKHHTCRACIFHLWHAQHVDQTNWATWSGLLSLRSRIFCSSGSETWVPNWPRKLEFTKRLGEWGHDISGHVRCMEIWEFTEKPTRRIHMQSLHSRTKKWTFPLWESICLRRQQLSCGTLRLSYSF